MRAAVLHLAFAGLGAEYATSGAFVDNHASLGVSRKLGYAEDGVQRVARRGRPATEQRLRLDRSGWEAHRTVPVEIEGLAPCLPLLGADEAPAAPGELSSGGRGPALGGVAVVESTAPAPPAGSPRPT